jgi:hypothetical protein
MVDINISKNKGEWSEVYAFLKLIAERRIVGAKNDALDPDKNQCLSILKVSRDDIVAVLEDIVTFKSATTGANIATSDYPSVAREAKKLLTAIKAGDKASFSLPGTAGYLNKLGFSHVAASNADKRDISVGVSDYHVGGEFNYGFSIKSDLGCAPTLLNASGATNVIFSLVPRTGMNVAAANSIKSRTKIMDRCSYLKEACSSIKFHGYQSNTFSDNLLLIDDGLPRIVAALVFARYFGGSNDYSCKSLLEIVKKQNPCGYHAAATGFYESKVSRFLEAVALGMKPSQSWGGETDATGGYLIVKRDGDLIAFYIYNRDRFKHYLVHNTFLEIASSTRHGFMDVYQDTTGRNLIKLNLQIRFK